MNRTQPNFTPEILTIDEHVGERILTARRLLGLDQEAVAGSLGLTVDYLDSAERGLEELTTNQLHLLAKRLDVNVDEFFRGYKDDLTFFDPLEYDDPTDWPEARQTLELVRAFIDIAPSKRGKVIDFVAGIAERQPRN